MRCLLLKIWRSEISSPNSTTAKGKRMKVDWVRGGPSQARKGRPYLLGCLCNQSHLVRTHWGASSEHGIFMKMLRLKFALLLNTDRNSRGFFILSLQVNNPADLWVAKFRSYQESCFQSDIRPESVLLGWIVVLYWEHPRSSRRGQETKGLCALPLASPWASTAYELDFEMEGSTLTNTLSMNFPGPDAIKKSSWQLSPVGSPAERPRSGTKVLGALPLLTQSLLIRGRDRASHSPSYPHQTSR